MFTGKVKKTVQLEFSDNGAPSPVRRIAACPNGRTFALLTDQLFIGGKKLHLLLPDGRTVTHFSLGTERIAVFTKQPDEYLLYDYSTLQKVCSYSLRPGELMVPSSQLPIHCQSNHFGYRRRWCPASSTTALIR